MTKTTSYLHFLVCVIRIDYLFSKYELQYDSSAMITISSQTEMNVESRYQPAYVECTNALDALSR